MVEMWPSGGWEDSRRLAFTTTEDPKMGSYRQEYEIAEKNGVFIDIMRHFKEGASLPYTIGYAFYEDIDLVVGAHSIKDAVSRELLFQLGRLRKIELSWKHSWLPPLNWYRRGKKAKLLRDKWYILNP